MDNIEYKRNLNRGEKMKLIVKDNYELASKEAYEIIKDLLVSNPKAVLGLATGSTPIGLYKNLIKGVENKEISFKDVQTVNLDEYVNLPVTHPESYYSFMHTNLFNYVDIKEENVHIPCGNGNLKENCDNYNKVLESLTQDMQLLGIGANGHIGFNEPGTSFDSLTHIVDLKEKTRQDNARFFDQDINKVPTQAITMGIKNIMDAKLVIIIASGKNKAEAVKALVNGPVTEDCPASILQNHPNTIVIVDKDAASLL